MGKACHEDGLTDSQRAAAKITGHLHKSSQRGLSLRWTGTLGNCALRRFGFAYVELTALANRTLNGAARRTRRNCWRSSQSDSGEILVGRRVVGLSGLTRAERIGVVVYEPVRGGVCLQVVDVR